MIDFQNFMTGIDALATMPPIPDDDGDVAAMAMNVGQPIKPAPQRGGVMLAFDLALA